MNNLVRQTQHIFVALTLAAFLTVMASPILSHVPLRNAGGWVTTLVECDSDTCG